MVHSKRKRRKRTHHRHVKRIEMLTKLRLDRILNTGAPHNVPAGHYADMSQVIAKYEKESYEANAKKLQQIKDNAVPCEHPLKGNLPTGVETVLM